MRSPHSTFSVFSFKTPSFIYPSFIYPPLSPSSPLASSSIMVGVAAASSLMFSALHTSVTRVHYFILSVSYCISELPHNSIVQFSVLHASATSMHYFILSAAGQSLYFWITIGLYCCMSVLQTSVMPPYLYSCQPQVSHCTSELLHNFTTVFLLDTQLSAPVYESD